VLAPQSAAKEIQFAAGFGILLKAGQGCLNKSGENSEEEPRYG
jgi:hypothetical protein